MLKNLFLGAVTALLVAFSGTAFAQNWYVQGDVGASKLEAKENGEKFKDNATAFRIGAGKDFGNIRYAVDYTYFGKLQNNETSGTDTYNAEALAHSVGFSAIYDFDTKTAFTPYVGARAGLNVLKFEATGTSSGAVVVSAEETKTQLGLGALAGVQYNFTPAMALNAGVEYNYLGKVSDADTKVNQYGVNVGLRYNF